MISAIRQSAPEKPAPLDPEVHAAFERRRRLRKGSIVGFIGLYVIASLFSFALPGHAPSWLSGIWIIGIVGLVLVGIFSWRCPRCGYYIAGHSSGVRYCWKCGVRLS
jgi:hypothetical protein